MAAEQIANWIVALISAGTALVPGHGREWYKDRVQSKHRRRRVRRLLAHHATTLAEDAEVFLSTARQLDGATDAEIARGYSDVSTSEHVYRDQIANRLDDLSDELILLFRDLDEASQAAAHSVSTLERWSSTYFGARDLSQSISGRACILPDTLGSELRRAVLAHTLLGNFARGTLRRLGDEGVELPDIARQRSIEQSRHQQQLPASTEHR